MSEDQEDFNRALFIVLFLLNIFNCFDIWSGGIPKFVESKPGIVPTTDFSMKKPLFVQQPKVKTLLPFDLVNNYFPLFEDKSITQSILG